MATPLPNPVRGQPELLTGRKIGQRGNFRYGQSIRDGFEATDKQKLPIRGLTISPFYEFCPDCDTFHLLKSCLGCFLSIFSKDP